MGLSRWLLQRILGLTLGVCFVFLGVPFASVVLGALIYIWRTGVEALSHPSQLALDESEVSCATVWELWYLT